MSDKRRQTSI